MSLGRHAYRHASSSSNNLLDHVWISEDFLASAFRRFANGQRRYESRVPGPLEARRRLAKRRNTALAGIAGTGPLDDIACLFGRNGREHMKWTTTTEGRKAKGKILDLLKYYWWMMLMVLGVGRFAFLSIEFAVAVAAAAADSVRV